MFSERTDTEDTVKEVKQQPAAWTDTVGQRVAQI
jgi:hypothetical protein